MNVRFSPFPSLLEKRVWLSVKTNKNNKNLKTINLRPMSKFPFDKNCFPKKKKENAQEFSIILK